MSNLINSDPEFHLTIGSSSEEPGLVGMPFASHGSEFGWSNIFGDVSIFEHFDGSDQSVDKEIVVNHGVEDVQTAVIRSTGKERPFALMEGNISNSLIVILHVFVRLRAHIHIEPNDLFIVGSQNEIVSLGVDGNGGNPLRARLVFSDDRLFLKIILEHSLDCAGKEVRLGGVESHASHDTLSLGERLLGGGTLDRVDQDLTSHLHVMGHGREVVSLHVPDKLRDDVFEFHGDHGFSSVVILEEPLTHVGFGIFEVLSLSSFKEVAGSLVYILGIKTGSEHVDVFFVGGQ